MGLNCGSDLLCVVCVLQEKTDWDAAKRALSDATFITRLIEVGNPQP
jgi:hypothetical protein